MRDATRRAWRRIARVVPVLAGLGLVLAGPTLVYLALGWPRATLPPVDGGQEDSAATAAVPPELAIGLMEVVRAGRMQAGVPSLSGAVAGDEGLAWAGAVGWADVGQRLPATIASRYRTGSVAKPVTAVALMRLAQAGRIDLDAPVGAGVADLPPALAAVTARQLASHTAGVRHYSPWPRWWPGWHEAASSRHYDSVAAGLDLFADDPLLFPPGTGFAYSTFGYSLLARRMELASALPFPALLEQEVFGPAAMGDSAVDVPAPMPARVAFYEGGQGRYVRARAVDSSYKIAGGGLVSTPADLARLGHALLEGHLLASAQRDAIWRPQPLAGGAPNPQGYALGWRVGQTTRLSGDGRPLRIVHHGGSQSGAAAFLLLVPDEGLAVAVMSNTGSARGLVEESAFELARQVLARRGATAGRD